MRSRWSHAPHPRPVHTQCSGGPQAAPGPGVQCAIGGQGGGVDGRSGGVGDPLPLRGMGSGGGKQWGGGGPSGPPLWVHEEASHCTHTTPMPNVRSHFQKRKRQVSKCRVSKLPGHAVPTPAMGENCNQIFEKNEWAVFGCPHS